MMNNNKQMFGGSKTFNMDLIFLERIDRNLDELDKATTQGDEKFRYRVLQTIFINTHFKYLEEKEKLLKDFSHVKNILNQSLSSALKQRNFQHQNIIISAAEEVLDKLHFKIILLLYENDLIHLKKIKSMTPEEEVIGDY